MGQVQSVPAQASTYVPLAGRGTRLRTHDERTSNDTQTHGVQPHAQNIAPLAGRGTKRRADDSIAPPTMPPTKKVKNRLWPPIKPGEVIENCADYNDTASGTSSEHESPAAVEHFDSDLADDERSNDDDESGTDARDFYATNGLPVVDLAALNARNQAAVTAWAADVSATEAEFGMPGSSFDDPIAVSDEEDFAGSEPAYQAWERNTASLISPTSPPPCASASPTVYDPSPTSPVWSFPAPVFRAPCWNSPGLVHAKFAPSSPSPECSPTSPDWSQPAPGADDLEPSSPARSSPDCAPTSPDWSQLASASYACAPTSPDWGSCWPSQRLLSTSPEAEWDPTVPCPIPAAVW